MKCPHCHKDITRHVRKAALAKAQTTGAKGGSVTGASKRRDVDYKELGRLGAEARARKTAQEVRAFLEAFPDGGVSRFKATDAHKERPRAKKISERS